MTPSTVAKSSAPGAVGRQINLVREMMHQGERRRIEKQEDNLGEPAQTDDLGPAYNGDRTFYVYDGMQPESESDAPNDAIQSGS